MTPRPPFPRRDARKIGRFLAVFFGLTASIALAADDPLAGATLTVYDGATLRQSALAAPEQPVMAVFSDPGAAPREVAVDTGWPARRGGGQLGIAMGPRHDRLRWQIGGRGAPNILSELEWKIPSAELRADARWTHDSGLTVLGHLAYAVAAEGKVRDSDYGYDNHQGEFSRSYSRADGSEMIDASLGLGWQIPLGSQGSIMPVAGIARRQNTYRMEDGRQTWLDQDLDGKNDISPFDIDGLHGRYRAVWTSGWLGGEATWRPFERLGLRLAARHHWFDYEAEGAWNLRRSFAHPESFTHRGNGRGWEAELGADLRLSGQHWLTLDARGQQLKLKGGVDTTHFANGTNSDLDLREVLSEDWSAHVGYRHTY